MSDVASYRERDNLAPALLVAAALHAGVFAIVMLAPSPPPALPVGSSVPINIVSSEPFTDTRPAIEAPQAESAATPTPVPAAPPQPPAAVLAPPSFSPAANPKAAHDKPVPAQPSLRPTRPSANSSALISHLNDIIANAQRSAGQPKANAPRGPARPETAPQARPDAGLGYSQSDLLGLQQLLERLWNPNCDVPGGESVRLVAKFKVGADGLVVGDPNVGGLDHSADGVVAAAARRALDAVRQVEPYAPSFRGQPIVVNFDAKEACSKR